MKTAFRLILLLLVAIVATAQISAKNNKNERMTREELAMAQANHIARELAFDEATTKKFVDTYCRCQQEIWALGPGRRAARQRCISDGNASPICKRFERSQKILDIRKKYYGEYSGFLTDAQIERVYQLEKSMMGRLATHRRGNRHRPADRSCPLTFGR